ncbi:MAG: hypothetical protein AAGI38_22500 [Bacteroidota bacterium]
MKRFPCKIAICICLSVWVLSSCYSPAEKSTHAKNQAQLPVKSSVSSFLKWEEIRDIFPNKEVLLYDFDGNGIPKNDLQVAVKLDPLAFDELAVKVKYYANWKEYLEIYYYSMNTIGGLEVGVFLAIREFNGTTYTFDLIHLDKEGEVKMFQPLAQSVEQAECTSYTRARIDKAASSLTQEILQKCFDEQAESNVAVDSIVLVKSLKDVSFKEIRRDTLR